jgi:acyl-CoA-binding protein
MSLETKFAKAVYLVRNGPPKEGVSTDEKLKVYALYKQATEGDCTASQVR